jgi:hypothetical protein
VLEQASRLRGAARNTFIGGVSFLGNWLGSAMDEVFPDWPSGAVEFTSPAACGAEDGAVAYSGEPPVGKRNSVLI